MFLQVYDVLRRLGIVRSQSEFGRLLGCNRQWIAGLRRRDGGAPQQVRQPTIMRLRSRLLRWRDTSPRPIAAALDDLLARLEADDAISRWLSRGR